jgi:ketosteroid isomerase-like protein
MRIVLALIVVLLAVTPVTADQADDEKAIRAIQSNWDEAWNRNDVKALSSLVAEDVRFVNVAGQVLTGQRV